MESEIAVNTSRSNDVLGVICSVGCAIHCALTPVILAALPSVSSIKLLADPIFHQAVAVICAVLVARAIVPAWRVHRSSVVAISATAGISLLMIAAFVLPDNCCTTSDSHNAEHSHDHPGHSHNHASTSRENDWKIEGSATKFRLVSAKESTHEDCCEHCKTCSPGGANSEDSHSQHWSKTLFTQQELAKAVGDATAVKIASIQPYLSPIGGLFLVIAHLVNIRLACCRNASCGVGPGDKNGVFENLT